MVWYCYFPLLFLLSMLLLLLQVIVIVIVAIITTFVIIILIFIIFYIQVNQQHYSSSSSCPLYPLYHILLLLPCPLIFIHLLISSSSSHHHHCSTCMSLYLCTDFTIYITLPFNFSSPASPPISPATVTVKNWRSGPCENIHSCQGQMVKSQEKNVFLFSYSFLCFCSTAPVTDDISPTLVKAIMRFHPPILDKCMSSGITNQPINQSTNQPISQSTNQPINQSTNQPISGHK